MAGLPVVRTGNVALDRFLEAVREYIESSKGGGNPQSKDRVLRVSDIPALIQLVEQAPPKPMTQRELDRLARDLQNTRLFQSLTGPGSALDGLIDGYPREVLADVRATGGRAQAGVATEAIVSATDNQALAAQVTTVTARLDDFDDGGPGIVTLEEAYLAMADRTTGLEGQYTLKVTAGGAMAGFGLAATSPVGGTPSSAFLISADKFAIVSPSYSGGLTNSPNFANVPFGVDASGVYINGTVRVNAGGAPIQDGIQGPAGPAGATGATGAPGARGATRTVRTIAGSTWSDSEANAAISALGFSPTLRDEVTLRNSDTSPTYVETRYWSGFAWASIGVTINGNLLVSGTITADKLAAGAITADMITTGNLALTGGNLTTYGGLVYATGNAGAGNGTIEAQTAGETGVKGWSTSSGGRGVFGYATNTNGVGVHGWSLSGPGVRCTGSFQWGSYIWSSPSGSTTQFLRADGSWATPTASADWATITGKPSTFPPDSHTHGYTTPTDVSNAIASNNVTATAAVQAYYSSGRTITIPGVGSWSGCSIT